MIIIICRMFRNFLRIIHNSFNIFVYCNYILHLKNWKPSNHSCYSSNYVSNCQPTSNVCSALFRPSLPDCYEHVTARTLFRLQRFVGSSDVTASARQPHWSWVKLDEFGSWFWRSNATESCKRRVRRSRRWRHGVERRRVECGRFCAVVVAQLTGCGAIGCSKPRFRQRFRSNWLDRTPTGVRWWNTGSCDRQLAFGWLCPGNSWPKLEL